MNLTPFIQLFILIPLAGFLMSLVIPGKSERVLSRIGFFTSGTNLTASLIFLVFWLLQNSPALNMKELSIYKSGNYEFLIDFMFDRITLVYLLVGNLLAFLITYYSGYYLHRENGYKRFFNTILFFYLGYNITILSGNFETLFIGWEVLGISSFLLISFYRERYLPVSNAVKVFSVYRIGDVGILLAMWASHHLWQENITFLKHENYQPVYNYLQSGSFTGVFISTMILLAAMVKSAQLPFSSWLPRAMEGPTPSSAIFYGSLSVHLGVFLLLRTHSFWENQLSIRILIGTVGSLTSLLAAAISKVQSTIKTQIAYASMAQIGLIFIEISLGWELPALIHFAGNAFLRTYQLLISPSVITYLIRDQFYNYEPKIRPKRIQDSFLKQFDYTLYLLNTKEWNLDFFTNSFIFAPLKKVGQSLNFLTYRNVFYFITPAYLLSTLFYFITESYEESVIYKFLPYLYSFIGLLMVLKSFSERKYPRLAWILVIFNHLWVVLALSFNEAYNFSHSLIYLSGIVVSGIIGFICLQILKSREDKFFNLNQYYGHIYEYPRLGFVFLISCLGLMGFPITMSFIGEDLLYDHIHENQFLLAFFNALAFIMGGIALIRMYARLFLGPHIKTYHESTIKSA